MVGSEPRLKVGDRVLYEGRKYEVTRSTVNGAVIHPLEREIVKVGNRTIRRTGRDLVISAWSDLPHVQ